MVVNTDWFKGVGPASGNGIEMILREAAGAGFLEDDNAAPSRVLLYSHDSWGLGHLRRSLAIAGAVTTRFAQTDVLLVSGSPCATQFELPARCDIIKLPSVSKDIRGQYVPRTLSSSLERTIRLRSGLILESYRGFDPDVIIVDHQLTGLNGEAMDMLQEARLHGKILIYGMRDILDAPDAVASSWSSREHYWALKHAYDRICIYGTPEVFDPRQQYEALKPFSNKIEFSGYLATPLKPSKRKSASTKRKTVLVTMGGGEDGRLRIDTYIRALQEKPPAWDTHIITGPLMDPVTVRHYKRKIQAMGLAGAVKINRFNANMPGLLQESDAVVSMAGYNSCAEIMQSRTPAILLPRRHPRQEQLIRARRLEQLGLARCIENEDPAQLHKAIEQALICRGSKHAYPAMDGLNNLCDMISGLTSKRAEQAGVQHAGKTQNHQVTTANQF